MSQGTSKWFKTIKKVLCGLFFCKICCPYLDIRGILRFNNELVRGIEHTQEDFDEILCIIDDYRTYCKSHEEYKNNKCTHAIANIERCYDERLEKHDFL